MGQVKSTWKGPLVVGIALIFHGAVFLVWQGSASLSQAPQAQQPQARDRAEGAIAVVSLLEEYPETSYDLGDVLTALPGAADQTGASLEEAYRDSESMPGDSSGGLAAGARGQSASTDRRDSAIRSQTTWNSDKAPQLGHTSAQPRGKHSPEALEKQSSPGYSSRQRNLQKARAGGLQAHAGLREGGARGGLLGQKGERNSAAETRFEAPPKARKKGRSGSVVIHSDSPRVSDGPSSSENAERGLAEESMHATARSNQKSPSIFELGAPSKGGRQGVGAGGEAGRSTAAHGGRGSAGQQGAGSGAKLAATRASKTIPYFSEMYRRIDKKMRFPRKLALALEQGDLVLRFRLSKQGELIGLRVSKKSEFAEFDKEALRAFSAAAPFGPVPSELLVGRSSLSIIAPYTFQNRLIR